ncbi:MAG TPA: YbaB/EbfC family nucleoid-associated protein [Candidatus Omnitrophota bacterium]|nr:YbaB/EbfC family nucleoid-associated protein [Candidatus Omnitrophota bacterium]
MVFGQFGDMVKQARDLQNNLKKVKDELSRMRYEAEVNGVFVIVDGEMNIIDVKVNPGVDPKKAVSSFKDAANRALKKSKDDAAERLKAATGGIKLPGM